MIPIRMPPLAVITGASSGIGRATAVFLGQRGWRVVLVARNLEALTAAAEEVRAAGGVPTIESVDVGDAEAVEALAARVIAREGVPDAVVNSAGSGEWRFIEELPANAGDRMIGAPYLAAYHATAAFMKPMLARGSGVFVHVGSPASIMPWPGATAYSAARWALRGLHEALVADLAGTGVASCHVVLGEVKTAYFDRADGSHERIPSVGRWIPVFTAEEAGAIVGGTVLRPRRQVVRPFLLQLFAWAHVVMPWFVEWLTRTTGAKRRTT